MNKKRKEEKQLKLKRKYNKILMITLNNKYNIVIKIIIIINIIIINKNLINIEIKENAK